MFVVRKHTVVHNVHHLWLTVIFAPSSQLHSLHQKQELIKYHFLYSA